MRKIELQPAIEVAEAWEDWCGESRWSKAMRDFGAFGGQVKWWEGYPQSLAAVPLCFGLYDKNGNEMPSKSRLKDIIDAIKQLKGRCTNDSGNHT